MSKREETISRRKIDLPLILSSLAGVLGAPNYARLPYGFKEDDKNYNIPQAGVFQMPLRWGMDEQKGYPIGNRAFILGSREKLLANGVREDQIQLVDEETQLSVFAVPVGGRLLSHAHAALNCVFVVTYEGVTEMQGGFKPYFSANLHFGAKHKAYISVSESEELDL